MGERGLSAGKCPAQRARDFKQRRTLVLPKHNDGRLQRRDGLERILLLGIEICELLLAKSRCRVERRLAGRDLLLKVLDLGVELSRQCSVLFDLSSEVCNPRLRISDRLRLLLVIGGAPARHLVKDLLVLSCFLLELHQHFLEQRYNLRHWATLVCIQRGGTPCAVEGNATAKAAHQNRGHQTQDTHLRSCHCTSGLSGNKLQ
mmetsp:Transcript_105673/g.337644  ORF Transcript_105673/g.337644 Transcript_105673/m.337644 type:complete len:203 (+) Transcript_105673:830-1438(+)